MLANFLHKKIFQPLVIFSENDFKNTLSQALTTITNMDDNILFFFIHNLKNEL
jgi:hypothetical protein